MAYTMANTNSLLFLSGICNILATEGVVPSLNYSELQALADTFIGDLRDKSQQEEREHAARRVIRYRLEWLLCHTHRANLQFDKLRAEGCLWSAVVATVCNHEHHYHAAQRD